MRYACVRVAHTSIQKEDRWIRKTRPDALPTFYAFCGSFGIPSEWLYALQQFQVPEPVVTKNFNAYIRSSPDSKFATDPRSHRAVQIYPDHVSDTAMGMIDAVRKSCSRFGNQGSYPHEDYTYSIMPGAISARFGDFAHALRIACFETVGKGRRVKCTRRQLVDLLRDLLLLLEQHNAHFFRKEPTGHESDRVTGISVSVGKCLFARRNKNPSDDDYFQACPYVWLGPLSNLNDVEKADTSIVNDGYIAAENTFAKRIQIQFDQLLTKHKFQNNDRTHSPYLSNALVPIGGTGGMTAKVTTPNLLHIHRRECKIMLQLSVHISPTLFSWLVECMKKNYVRRGFDIRIQFCFAVSGYF
jgi:hypothetical protein